MSSVTYVTCAREERCHSEAVHDLIVNQWASERRRCVWDDDDNDDDILHARMYAAV